MNVDCVVQIQSSTKSLLVWSHSTPSQGKGDWVTRNGFINRKPFTNMLYILSLLQVAKFYECKDPENRGFGDPLNPLHGNLSRSRSLSSVRRQNSRTTTRASTKWISVISYRIWSHAGPDDAQNELVSNPTLWSSFFRLPHFVFIRVYSQLYLWILQCSVLVLSELSESFHTIWTI